MPLNQMCGLRVMLWFSTPFHPANDFLMGILAYLPHILDVFINLNAMTYVVSTPGSSHCSVIPMGVDLFASRELKGIARSNVVTRPTRTPARGQTAPCPVFQVYTYYCKVHHYYCILFVRIV